MQQITLDALESALAPLEAIGKSETTFDVNGTSVSLRILVPEEEINSQRYASEILANSEGKEGYDALEYLERFKIAVLSYAICSVGPLDLRDVKFVETGATLDNGMAVKEAKHMAMRKLLARWTQDIRTRMFNKYSELLVKVENAAEKAITYEPTDLDTEIDRMEKRLVTLKDEKARRSKPDSTGGIREQVKTITELDDKDKQERQDAIQDMIVKRAVNKPLEEQPLPENVPVSPALGPQRQQIFASAAVPPPEKPPVTPQQAQQPLQSATPNPPQQPSPRPADQSFVDTGDTEGLMAAINAENQRLMAMRQGRMPVEPSALNILRNPVPPPHVAAREVADDLDSEESRILAATRAALANPAAQLDGVEAYKQLPEVLDRRAVTPQSVAVNTAVKSPVNPRFKPVK